MELKKRGSTVVLITHRPSAIGVADRLLLLKDGKVFREGPRDEVLAALRPPTAPSTTSPQNPVAPAQPAQP
jgi:ATP-binding cassette subfamily C exporter for protease/lipase